MITKFLTPFLLFTTLNYPLKAMEREDALEGTRVNVLVAKANEFVSLMNEIGANLPARKIVHRLEDFAQEEVNYTLNGKKLVQNLDSFIDQLLLQRNLKLRLEPSFAPTVDVQHELINFSVHTKIQESYFISNFRLFFEDTGIDVGFGKLKLSSIEEIRAPNEGNILNLFNDDQASSTPIQDLQAASSSIP